MIKNEGSSLDADDVLRTAEVTLQHLETTSIGQNKCVDLLRELYEKIKSYLEQEVNLQDVVFTAQEMAAWVTPQCDSESASKFVRRHLSSYEEFVAQNSEELDRALKGSGCPGRLTVAKLPSRGGHKAYYYLSLDSWDQDHIEADDSAPTIRYRVTRFKKPRPWARVFLDIDLEGAGVWMLPLACQSLSRLSRGLRYWRFYLAQH